MLSADPGERSPERRPGTQRVRIRRAIFRAAAVALLLGILLAHAQRKLDEQRYLLYLEAEYLPRYRDAQGVWPERLDGVPEDAGKRRTSYLLLLWTHQRGRPEFRLLQSDALHCKAEVKFRWLDGGRYPVEATARPGEPGARDDRRSGPALRPQPEVVPASPTGEGKSGPR